MDVEVVAFVVVLHLLLIWLFVGLWRLYRDYVRRNR